MRGLKTFIGDLWLGFIVLGAAGGAVAPAVLVVYIFYELLR